MSRSFYILLVVMSLMTSSCTSVFGDVRATFEYAFQEQQDVHLTRTEIDQFPYTALYANWAGRPRIMVVLGYVEGNEYHWITGDNETLITNHGRVVRTALLDFDLLHLSNLQADPLRCIGQVDASDCNLRWTRVAQFENANGDYVAARVVSELQVAGPELIELPTGEVDAVKVVERGEFQTPAAANRDFENIFWLASDGHVLKSVQRLGPDRAPITLTQVKWVGRDD